MDKVTNEEYLISEIKNNNRLKPVEVPYNLDKIFFTSDSHHFHRNIMTFCQRPFDSVEEMNEELIRRWNNVVTNDSVVFDLGDFAFAGTGGWRRLLKRLNGLHVLIKGNHDRSRAPQPSALNEFPVICENLTIKIEDQVIYLNHFPYLCFDGTYRKTDIPWQLFGHVHLNSCKEKNTGKDFERLKLLFTNQYDVGVDFNNYTPISYLEVKEKIEYQMQNNVNCLHWIK